MVDYRAFLEAKVPVAARKGHDIVAGDVHPLLKPHQVAIVQWAVAGGRRAIFASFGLGKSLIQLETVRLTLAKTGGRGLIILPLGVRQEFTRDAAMIGTPVRFIRRIEECGVDEGPEPIFLTNYETVRDGKLDPTAFACVSLDEAACLRGFGGTKTFREFMRRFEGSGIRRFVATATPDPNEYIELLAYAAFLDVMDVGEAKTRFFKRDSVHADRLTIHPHKVKEFWLWVASWAIFVRQPSDLGYSDEGYALPPMAVHWHEVPSDHATAGSERDGQARMFKDAAYGVSEAAREKRESLEARIAKLLELRALDPGAHRLLWHDLEAERHAIEQAVPTATSIYGSQDLETREAAIIAFSDGQFQELAAKPVIAGSGCNFQRHCAWAIFLGIGFKFNDFIQAVHRIHRFLQGRPVRIDLIYTEAERPIRRVLEAKWARHTEQAERMSEIIKEYGLAEAAIASALKRQMEFTRQEISGAAYRLINGDAVVETRALPADSVDLIITSIPFSTQYEYTPNYHDFGHTDDNAHFWAQMDYLTPELLRVLKPGRVCAIHVKDRIAPGGLTGMGFQTVQPFHCEAVMHYLRHGFAFIGQKTVVTDVVRENNQTYRLGWSEQCKDGSRMGVGMSEYVLLFRKPPTDRSNGYADVPVTKDKKYWQTGTEKCAKDCASWREENCSCGAEDRNAAGAHWEHPNGYSLGRWQIDAHGFERSSGNRPLTPEELGRLPHEQIYKLHRKYSLSTVYDYEQHVAMCEQMTQDGRLPVTFMLLPPQSWHPDVWTDVARMRTLNMLQERKGQEFHLCPIAFDIVDRLIVQHSMPGELVFDPFSGLGTTAYCAIRLKRRGLGIDLNTHYHADAVSYCQAAEREGAIPTLFDLMEETAG